MRKPEIRLTPADKLQINFGKDLGIQKRAMERAGGIVYAEAAAQRIQRSRGASSALMNFMSKDAL